MAQLVGRWPSNPEALNASQGTTKKKKKKKGVWGPQHFNIHPSCHACNNISVSVSQCTYLSDNLGTGSYS
jgi:hypothetical protein